MGKLLQFPRRLTPADKMPLREKAREVADLWNRKFKPPDKPSPPEQPEPTKGKV